MRAPRWNSGLLCRLGWHRWRVYVGTDYGTVHVATVTMRECTRRGCPTLGRRELVSSKVAGLGHREPPPA